MKRSVQNIKFGRQWSLWSCLEDFEQEPNALLRQRFSLVNERQEFRKLEPAYALVEAIVSSSLFGDIKLYYFVNVVVLYISEHMSDAKIRERRITIAGSTFYIIAL